MGEDFTDPLRPLSFLVGIVSFGPRFCGTPGFPGVYTVSLIFRTNFIHSLIRLFYLCVSFSF